MRFHVIWLVLFDPVLEHYGFKVSSDPQIYNNNQSLSKIMVFKYTSSGFAEFVESK